MKKSILVATLLSISILISACAGNQSAIPTPSITSTPSFTPTATITLTSTPTITPTITPTLTPVPILGTNVSGLVPIARCGVGKIYFSNSIAFSPDGSWLGVPGFGGTQIFNTNNPGLSPIFLGQDFTTNIFSFSSDGKTLASVTPDKIRIWDFLTGKLLRTIDGDFGSNIFTPQQALAFSEDGKTLVFGLSNTIIFYDVNTGQQIHSISLNYRSAAALKMQFSRDLSLLATSVTTGSDIQELKVFDTQSGSQKFAFANQAGVIVTAFSPDGSVLAIGYGDKTIILRDLTTGKKIKTLHGHSSYVTALAFSPDGKTLASSSADDTTILWDLDTSKPINKIDSGNAAIAFSPDGKLLALGSWDNLYLYDLVSGGQLIPISGDFCITDVHTSLQESIRTANSLTNKESFTLSSVYEDWLFISPDNQHVVINYLREFEMWDLVTGTRLKQPCETHCGTFAYSSDGKIIASSVFSDNLISTINLRDALTGEKLSALTGGHTSQVFTLAFSPDGKTLASGDVRGTVSFWNIATGALESTLSAMDNDLFKGPNWKIPSTDLRALAFSPDGKILATGFNNHGVIILWDIATKKPLRFLNGGEFYLSYAQILPFKFSADGSLLIGHDLIWGFPENLSRYPVPLVLPSVTTTP